MTVEFTRFRIEACGSTRHEVEVALIDEAAKIRTECGGLWEQEKPPEILTSRERYWGFCTIRRVDEQSSPVL